VARDNVGKNTLKFNEVKKQLIKDAKECRVLDEDLYSEINTKLAETRTEYINKIKESIQKIKDEKFAPTFENSDVALEFETVCKRAIALAQNDETQLLQERSEFRSRLETMLLINKTLFNFSHKKLANTRTEMLFAKVEYEISSRFCDLTHRMLDARTKWIKEFKELVKIDKKAKEIIPGVESTEARMLLVVEDLKTMVDRFKSQVQQEPHDAHILVLAQAMERLRFSDFVSEEGDMGIIKRIVQIGVIDVYEQTIKESEQRRLESRYGG